LQHSRGVSSSHDVAAVLVAARGERVCRCRSALDEKGEREREISSPFGKKWHYVKVKKNKRENEEMRR